MEGEDSSTQACSESCGKLFEKDGMPHQLQKYFEGEDCVVMEECENQSDSNHKDTAEVEVSSLKGVVPEMGMEFDSEREAYVFYNEYAKKAGFSVRKQRGHKDRNGFWLDKIYCCSCEGERDKKVENPKFLRTETRFGCLARMKVSSRVNGRYRIIQFIEEHTHSLAPGKNMSLRSHRNCNPSQAAELEMLDQSGVAPKSGIEPLAGKASVPENLELIPDDCKNRLHSKRTQEMRVSDTGVILEYLQNMQFEDPNFSYAIQVDVDGLITNIFWADSRMKLDYESFGDVVCFDTTYRKNKEGRPLALFVGVNHHKESIVFGATLLYDETCNTFIWLFDSFLKVMSGKRPTTILTDQDSAMAEALGQQWPDTNHRLCLCHIYHNAAKHLRHVFDNFRSFASDFSSCIYDHDDEEDFLSAWEAILQKYGLRNNTWLQDLFELKEKWALVYGRQTFCADMSTALRSESMNSQIKHVSYKCDLSCFFLQFQRSLDDRKNEELKADLSAAQSFPSLPYEIEILMDAASAYTPAIFKIFSEQVYLTWNCEFYKDSACGSVSNYKVVPPGKQRHHMVAFDESNITVSCSCKKFEFVGILCAHALKVLSLYNVKRLPGQYILKRWTKKARDVGASSSSFSTELDVSKSDINSRYKALLRSYAHLAARAALSEHSFNIAVSDGAKTLEVVDAKLRSLLTEDCAENSSLVKLGDTCQDARSVILDGQSSKIEGINCNVKTGKDDSSSRRKSAIEKARMRRKQNLQTSTRASRDLLVRRFKK